ncbi:host specificity factor TipJ family phage tail protein [Aliarcobacter lanthieri]|uniref:host specificity factor TipJ family phage tail protein n=1 Tax=Aliarcobacter lanthieri TaxID=1355374 RepID=UPI003AABF07D
MALLTTINNPFDRSDKTTIKIDGGLAIFHYLKNFDETLEIIVSLNGEIIEDFTYIVRQDDHIGVIPIPKGGGGGGKQVLSIVAMVGISIATMGAGSAVAGAYGFAGAGAAFTAGAYGVAAMAVGASMAVAVGGTLLLNALMPSPKSNNPTSSLEEISPTYAFGSSQNIAKEGTALPLIIGKRRVIPPIKGYYLTANGDKQTINMLFAVAEGEIDSIEDIYIDGQPIQNYPNVTFQTTLGTPNQSVISNFTDTITTISQARGLNELNSEVVYTTQGNAVNEIDIVMTIPSGLFSIDSSSGSYNSYNINFELSYRKEGTTTWTNETHSLSGVYKTVNRFTYNIKTPTPGRYEVKIKRTSEYNATTTIANSLMLDYVNEIIYDDFIYPGEALLSIQALATEQLNNSFPVVSCIATNIKSGGYENQPKDNPAWGCYYLLKYDEVEENNIDLEAFIEWANWCDEKGYKANLYLDTQQDLQNALDMISLMGRATVVQFGSKFAPIINKPIEIPAQKFLFNRANVVNGDYTLTYIPYQDRANCVEVTYYDEEDNYNPKTIQVQSNFYDATTVENKASITLYSCTNKDKAARLAKLYLNQNQYLSESISFTASNDAIVCKVGDVIEVGVKYLTNTIADGRLKEVAGSVIQFDSFFELEKNKEYQFDFRLENDEIIIINYKHNDETTVTDTVDLGENIEVLNSPLNILYCIGHLGTGATNSYRVLNISRNNDTTRMITALEYNPTIYDDEVDVIIEPVVIEDDVMNLKATENLIKDINGIAHNKLTLTWISFLNTIKKIYINNTYVGETRDNRYEIPNDLLEGEIYDIRVNNTKISYKYIGVYVPYPVQDIFHSSVNGQTTITWEDENVNVNFSHYEIFINNDKFATQVPSLSITLDRGTYTVKIRVVLSNSAKSEFKSYIMGITTPSMRELIRNNYLLEKAFRDGVVTIFVGKANALDGATPFDLWRVTPSSLKLEELTYASEQLKLLSWNDFKDGQKVIYKYFDGTNWLICNAEQRLVIEKSLQYVSSQALEDGAYRIFNTTPFVPYANGDLWLFGDKIRVSLNKRLDGNFVLSDWVESDDDRLNISPAVDVEQVVKDGENITTEIIRAGLNSTPTKLGFFDGIKWRSFIASNGDFNFENKLGTSYIKYDSTSGDLLIKGKITATSGSDVGGSTSYYSAFAPDGKNVGDTWTNSITNVKKIWDGTSWIDDNLAKAINNSTTTINGGKITANTITADKFGANRLVNVSAYNANGEIIESLVRMDINFAQGYIYIK